MAGYASVLMAWLSGDLGQLGAADTHARAGAMFAGTSGSVELQAWVQAVRSKTAFWLGDYRDAAELATAGLEAAPATSVRVLLAAQVADAWSILGAQAPARAAVSEVLAARDALTTGDTIGDSCRARRLVRPTISAGCISSWAQRIQLNRVDAFLDLGDVEAVGEALRPVFRLPQDRRLLTLTRRVAQVSQALTAPRFASSPASKALREQALAFPDGSPSAAT